MSKRKFDHLHKYKRFNIGASGKEYLVFRCMMPGCTHYVPVEQALGRPCVCNRCNEPMILNKESVKLSKPHCANCVERIIAGEPVKAIVVDVEAFLKDKGIE